MTQWRVVDPIGSLPDSPMITFTFDDFPISSVETGGDILAEFGVCGTYYACSGLSGLKNLTGDLYSDTHLQKLSDAGHEIGAHTDTHLDCASSRIETVSEDIDKNLRWLSERGIEPSAFAYPYGETTVALKRALRKKFATSRGILPGINSVGNDFTQLRSMELSPDGWTHDRASAAIEKVTRNNGWLIFFTHDVREMPSPFGVQADVLRRLVRQARESGADLVTMREAASRLGRSRI
ncbi:MAG: polysaccharide deacetylase family protein [Pseudomonadota bacterium]